MQAAPILTLKAGLTVTNPVSKQSYVVQKQLGSGSFSITYEAIRTSDDTRVAIKVTDTSKMHPKQVESFLNEVRFLMRLSHPNIVKCLDSFKFESYYCTVLEFCPEGSLLELRQKQPGQMISIGLARPLIRQAALGLEYIHRNGIVHRDLKPENIMLKEGNIKIIDFGFAKESKNVCQSVLGTIPYVAPEITRNFLESEDTRYDAPVDVWSLGVVYFEMLTGHLPFDAPSMQQMYVKQRDNVRSVNLNHYNVPAEDQDAINRMLAFDPNQRITISQALQQYAFFAQAEPQKRPSSLFGSLNRYNLPPKQSDTDTQPSSNTSLNPFPEAQVNPTGEEEITTVKVRNARTEAAKKIVLDTIDRYLNYMNMVNVLADPIIGMVKTVEQTKHCVLPFVQGVFLLIEMKKEFIELLQSIKSKENKFNCPYPNELFNHQKFYDIEKLIEERLKLVDMHLEVNEFQLVLNMEECGTPNPDIIEHLTTESSLQMAAEIAQREMPLPQVRQIIQAAGDNKQRRFEIIFKFSIINYVISILETMDDRLEKHRNQQHNEDVEDANEFKTQADILLKHALETSEALLYKSVYKNGEERILNDAIELIDSNGREQEKLEKIARTIKWTVDNFLE